ncbi:UNVERIFIED_CONTAM: hypothetical protein Slati_2381800 [Sesamum latifolium]|uniref:Uncharacterized protein n=1 Tax=Sesamum latifolium TaxID=2727402 RepID=A0AAW2WBH8_9LAMI
MNPYDTWGKAWAMIPPRPRLRGQGLPCPLISLVGDGVLNQAARRLLDEPSKEEGDEEEEDSSPARSPAVSGSLIFTS